MAACRPDRPSQKRKRRGTAGSAARPGLGGSTGPARLFGPAVTSSATRAPPLSTERAGPVRAHRWSSVRGLTSPAATTVLEGWTATSKPSHPSGAVKDSPTRGFGDRRRSSRLCSDRPAERVNRVFVGVSRGVSRFDTPSVSAGFIASGTTTVPRAVVATSGGSSTSAALAERSGPAAADDRRLELELAAAPADPDDGRGRPRARRRRGRARGTGRRSTTRTAPRRRRCGCTPRSRRRRSRRGCRRRRRGCRRSARGCTARSGGG